jgi:hypothetical protein
VGAWGIASPGINDSIKSPSMLNFASFVSSSAHQPEGWCGIQPECVETMKVPNQRPMGVAKIALDSPPKSPNDRKLSKMLHK